MKIINSNVIKDIEKNCPINLNLGSGGGKIEGYYGVDHAELEGVDIVADLNQLFDQFPDDCVKNIYSRHVLEHINEFLPLMNELHRIMMSTGKLEIVVPHFSNVYGFSDPTHVRFFGLYTMNYFCDPEYQPTIRKVPSFYSEVRFTIEKVRIEFYTYSFFDKTIIKLLGKIINKSTRFQEFYERRLSSFFHASQIRYYMSPVK